MKNKKVLAIVGAVCILAAIAFILLYFQRQQFQLPDAAKVEKMHVEYSYASLSGKKDVTDERNIDTALQSIIVLGKTRPGTTDAGSIVLRFTLYLKDGATLAFHIESATTSKGRLYDEAGNCFEVISPVDWQAVWETLREK